MWTVVVAILAGVPAVYALYVTVIMLRAMVALKRLSRECPPRRFEVAWEPFVMFPDDMEDPLVLHVTLRRGARGFSFTIFPSMASSFRFTRVKVEPLTICKHLSGRVAVEPKDDPVGLEAVYMPKETVVVHSFGREEVDARYRLREDTSRPRAPDELTRISDAIARPEVWAEVAAFGGSLAFEYGYMSVSPARGGVTFLDGLEKVARIADALDDAAKGAGPYR